MFDPAFLQFENVVITPHIASSSRATRGAMMQLAADNLLAHARGLPLLTPVV
jgi:lactate dehydrogenase-like 2-hydroxyacid dehydrogenase